MPSSLNPERLCVVSIERAAQHVAVVTIDRPEARNAVDPAVAKALDAAVRDLEADADTWVVVLTGAGGQVFCAGADLKVVAAGGMDDLFTKDGGFAGFVLAQRTKPWIAAIEGLALAGGCEIALACDLIVAARGGGFGLPEVSRGLVAAAGGLYRLPRRLPPTIATELLLTANRMTSERAAELGMVNRLAASGQAVATALDLAGQIVANAPLAVRETLAIVRAAAQVDDAILDRAGRDAQARLSKTEDFGEGPRAFIEKRPPVWFGR